MVDFRLNGVHMNSEDVITTEDEESGANFTSGTNGKLPNGMCDHSAIINGNGTGEAGSDNEITIIKEVINVKRKLGQGKVPFPVSQNTSLASRTWLTDLKKRFYENSGQDSSYLMNPTATDFYYFESYSHHDIHETMLKDKVRTLTYRNAVLLNKHLFKGKTVLDVGCGTGILSMFAAQAGAAHVIGIDNADIALYARKIVQDNGFESVVTIIRGKVEEVELPEHIDKVDIIISEWMGYCLLLESMLETVLFARDKWLKFNGILMPDKCSLFLAGIEDGQNRTNRITWWGDFGDFDLGCIKEEVAREAKISTVNPDQMVTNGFEVLHIDLSTVYKEELSFRQSFRLEIMKNTPIHAFTTFFSVEFSRCHTSIGFSTSPKQPRTHWRQTVFYLKNVIQAKKGEFIEGEFSLKKSWGNFRSLMVHISYEFNGELTQCQESNAYCVH